MKNTTFKRRALISSIAMLLVALVALGSATFAWFSANPNATATGLKMKASASKGLVIMTQSAKTNASATTWEHTDYLNCNDARTGSSTDPVALSAMSIDQGTSAFASFTTTAQYDTEFTADPNAAVTSATGAAYTDTIFTKITGGTASEPIKISSMTIDTTGLEQALTNSVRIALYYSADGSTESFIGEYAVAAHSSEKHLTGTATKYSEAASANKDVKAVGAAANQALGNALESGESYLKVYAYLDGEDSDCYTNHVESAATIINSITINLAIAS